MWIAKRKDLRALKVKREDYALAMMGSSSDAKKENATVNPRILGSVKRYIEVDQDADPDPEGLKQPIAKKARRQLVNLM